MRRSKHPTLSLLILSTLLCFLSSMAPAAEKGTGGEIAQKREALKEIRKKIDRKKKEVASIATKEKSMFLQLKELHQNISTIEKKIGDLNERLGKNRKEKLRNKKKLRAVKKEMERGKAALAENMRELYTRGRFSNIKAFFASRSFTDLLLTVNYSKRVAQRDARLIEERKKQVKEIEEIQETLRATEISIADLIKHISLEKKKVEKERLGKRALHRKIRTKKKLYLKAQKEMERAAKGLGDLITSLEKKLKKEKSFQPSGFSRQKRALPWPVGGKIVSSYGKKKDPKFNVFTFNNGIEIKTEIGTAVKAVHGGKVIFSDWFRGYGKLVILDNGEGFYTLYGHLQEISVTLGTIARKGDLLGKAGETDSLRGNTLYFEIRKNGKPVNPLKWLSARR